MREYEAVYIFRSAAPDEEIEGKLDRYHGIVSGNGGELTAVEHWGKRQLSYPIRNDATGYYVVSQFTAEPGAVEELERVLRLDEGLLRHLIVLREGELPTLPSSRVEEEEEEEDEDEDGDDEEE